jgi:hypothetical protein
VSDSFYGLHITSIAADDANVFWSTVDLDQTTNTGTCAINTIRR